MFICLLAFGLFRFHGTDALSNVDALSFQISLLTIILTVISLGGGMIAFIGWREIRRITEEKIESQVYKYLKENEPGIVKCILQYFQTNENIYGEAIEILKFKPHELKGGNNNDA